MWPRGSDRQTDRQPGATRSGPVPDTRAACLRGLGLSPGLVTRGNQQPRATESSTKPQRGPAVAAALPRCPTGRGTRLPRSCRLPLPRHPILWFLAIASASLKATGRAPSFPMPLPLVRGGFLLCHLAG